MSKLPNLASLCLLLSLAAASASAAAAKPAPATRVAGADQVHSTTLANGMKVIVWTDRDIPNIALYNWVRVGSRNEVSGITGLAHFFEHMMFNGTSKRQPGEFDRQMEARGGANNAFTSDNVTVYQDWVPRSALDLVFDLESDRLANLSFDPKVVESERGVVYSERRLRTEDSNEGFLFEQVQATAFVAHPYQIPTIGWPADIQSWKLEDLQKFFKTNYAPNNCTLILVGDVSADEAFAMAKRYLEPIPQQDPPPRCAPPSPSSSARSASTCSAMRRRRSCTSRTNRRLRTIRRAPPSICWCPSSPKATPRVCTACWSKRRSSPSRSTAVSRRVSIRGSPG
jgi:zinc protease